MKNRRNLNVIDRAQSIILPWTHFALAIGFDTRMLYKNKAIYCYFYMKIYFLADNETW